MFSPYIRFLKRNIAHQSSKQIIFSSGIWNDVWKYYFSLKKWKQKLGNSKPIEADDALCKTRNCPAIFCFFFLGKRTRLRGLTRRRFFIRNYFGIWKKNRHAPPSGRRHRAVACPAPIRVDRPTSTRLGYWKSKIMSRNGQIKLCSTRTTHLGHDGTLFKKTHPTQKVTLRVKLIP